MTGLSQNPIRTLRWLSVVGLSVTGLALWFGPASTDAVADEVAVKASTPVELEQRIGAWKDGDGPLVLTNADLPSETNHSLMNTVLIDGEPVNFPDFEVEFTPLFSDAPVVEEEEEDDRGVVLSPYAYGVGPRLCTICRNGRCCSYTPYPGQFCPYVSSTGSPFRTGVIYPICPPGIYPGPKRPDPIVEMPPQPVEKTGPQNQRRLHQRPERKYVGQERPQPPRATPPEPIRPARTRQSRSRGGGGQ